MSKRLRKRHEGNHLPAYMHDEKIVLVKNTTRISFLWRHCGEEILLQIDNIRSPGRRGGTKVRTVHTMTKEKGRQLWKAYLTQHGYVKV